MPRSFLSKFGYLGTYVCSVSEECNSSAHVNFVIFVMCARNDKHTWAMLHLIVKHVIIWISTPWFVLCNMKLYVVWSILLNSVWAQCVLFWCGGLSASYASVNTHPVCLKKCHYLLLQMCLRRVFVAVVFSRQDFQASCRVKGCESKLLS